MWDLNFVWGEGIIGDSQHTLCPNILCIKFCTIVIIGVFTLPFLTAHANVLYSNDVIINTNVNKLAFVLGGLETLRSTVESKLTVVYNQFV